MPVLQDTWVIDPDDRTDRMGIDGSFAGFGILLYIILWLIMPKQQIG